jgi:hypothetical protein
MITDVEIRLAAEAAVPRAFQRGDWYWDGNPDHPASLVAHPGQPGPQEAGAGVVWIPSPEDVLRVMHAEGWRPRLELFGEKWVATAYSRPPIPAFGDAHGADTPLEAALGLLLELRRVSGELAS